jgi:hypothetical protein
MVAPKTLNLVVMVRIHHGQLKGDTDVILRSKLGGSGPKDAWLLPAATPEARFLGYMEGCSRGVLGNTCDLGEFVVLLRT